MISPTMAFALVIGLANAALADPAITADAFDALTRGKTMTWSDGGAAYGVEQYLPDRRVRWTAFGDTCVTGHWYAKADLICFQYEHREDPACWTIRQTGDTMIAVDADDPQGVFPVTVAETDVPLVCAGPDVGT
jgi:hypothetical protein